MFLIALWSSWSRYRVVFSVSMRRLKEIYRCLRAIWQTSLFLRSPRIPNSVRSSSETDSITPLAPARTFVGNNVKNTHKYAQKIQSSWLINTNRLGPNVKNIDFGRFSGVTRHQMALGGMKNATRWTAYRKCVECIEGTRCGCSAVMLKPMGNVHYGKKRRVSMTMSSSPPKISNGKNESR